MKESEVSFVKKHASAVVCLMAVICAGGALLLFEHELLWRVQELDLWLGSCQFIQEKMVVPGGLLMWIGAWCTQFFFYPWLGVLLLCACWLLLMWLTKRAFRIPDHWSVMTLVPVALLLITIVDLGYWIFVLKLQGHCFVATIGLIAAVALVWVYRSLPDNVFLRAAFIIVCGIVGYPLLGVYGLAAVLLMGLSRKPFSITLSSLSVITAVAIPLLAYRFVYYETSLAGIYRAALPLYTITDTHWAYYIPFCLLALFYIGLTLFPLPAENTLKLRWLPSLSLLILISAGVYFSWFKDENFHRELSMNHAISDLDWQRVLDEAAKQKDEPTRAIVIMKDLALARLGRLGDEMYQYRNGSKAIRAPFPMRLLMSAGPLVYYHYGMPNCCSRICMEMGVEFGWNVEYFKYMARCAILNGEDQLARKYLDILGQTLFAAHWAEETGKLVGREELVRNDPEMAYITHMMCYDNLLTSDDGFVESFVMKTLAASKKTDDPIFLEQCMLASLRIRDLELFWKRLGIYAKLHPNQQLPVHYQEAALLCLVLHGQSTAEWPFDTSVRESYRMFNEMAGRYDDQEIGAVREALFPLFGRTFFYEYYLMANLPEY